jgi:hypothetical protein
MENKTSTFNARRVPLVLAIFLLSGCGGSNGSPASSNVSHPAAGKPKLIEPGQWELTTTINADVIRPFGSLPPTDPGGTGVEPTKRVLKVCVTPDIAAEPTPALAVANDGITRCDRNVWKFRDGRIDGDLTCPSGRPNIPGLPVRIAGTFTRDHFSTRIDGNTVSLDFHQEVDAKRLGDCTGYERPN